MTNDERHEDWVEPVASCDICGEDLFEDTGLCEQCQRDPDARRKPFDQDAFDAFKADPKRQALVDRILED